MGWFTKSASAEELEALKQQVSSMAARLRETDERRQALAEPPTPSADDDTTPPTSVAAPPPAPVDPPATATDLAELREQVLGLAARVDAADERMTSISTELAHQITELGNEAAGGDLDGVDLVLDDLRSSQERLANEQARYQIAFRQDLATLADRLNPRPS